MQDSEQDENKKISDDFMRILREDKDRIQFYRLAHKYGLLDKKDLLDKGIMI